MLVDTHSHRSSEISERVVRLYLDDIDVGKVLVRGHDGSWGFGEFTPSPEFSPFAAIFGRWSLLMHAEDVHERLSRAASDELRAVEYEIDALHAKLLLEPTCEWRPLRQITIDGTLIEWKE